MSKQTDLDNLDRIIKNGEIRLHTVKINIDSLTKEIDMLDNLEIQLKENVRCLKKKNIIAIAAEFKKAREDLEKTRRRLVCLKNDRENFKKASSEVEASMQKAREDMDKIRKSGENNVLRGTFGRKDDGQG